MRKEVSQRSSVQFMDLFITQGSHVLKGWGNFPGHQPNASERVKRTAERGERPERRSGRSS